MAVLASLVISQAATSSAPSTAFAGGVVGQDVTLSNATNTNVERWVYAFTDVPFDSALSVETLSDSTVAQTTTFMPDVPGTYQISITVYDAPTGGNSSTDVHDFEVPDTAGRNALYPAFGDTPAIANEPGNLTGWKRINKIIKDVVRNAFFTDTSHGATSGQVWTWNGSSWGPQSPGGGGGGGAGFSDDASAVRTLKRAQMGQNSAPSAYASITLASLGIPNLTDNGGQVAGSAVAMVGATAYFAGYDSVALKSGSLYGVNLMTMTSLTAVDTPVHVYAGDAPIDLVAARTSISDVATDGIFAGCSSFVEFGSVDGAGNYTQLWQHPVPPGATPIRATFLGGQTFAYTAADGNVYIAEAGSVHLALNLGGVGGAIFRDVFGFVWISVPGSVAVLQCSYNSGAFTFTVAQRFGVGVGLLDLVSNGRFAVGLANDGSGNEDIYSIDLQTGASGPGPFQLGTAIGAAPRAAFDGRSVWTTQGVANTSFRRVDVEDGKSRLVSPAAGNSSTRTFRTVSPDDSGGVLALYYDTSLPSLGLSYMLPTDTAFQNVRTAGLVPGTAISFANGGRIQGTYKISGTFATAVFDGQHQIAQVDSTTGTRLLRGPTAGASFFTPGYEVWIYDDAGAAGTNAITFDNDGGSYLIEDPNNPGSFATSVVLTAPSFSCVWVWTGVHFKLKTSLYPTPTSALGRGGIYGPGTAALCDGNNVTIDGTVVIPGITNDGIGNATLTRDVYLFGTCTLNLPSSSKRLFTGGFVLYVDGTLNGVRGAIEANPVGQVGKLGGGGGGGTGGTVGSNGTAGASTSYSVGGNGGNGGNAPGGALGGFGGVATPPAAAFGGFKSSPQVTLGMVLGWISTSGSPADLRSVQGGGGGGGGASSVSFSHASDGIGGGGGIGGGIALVIARKVKGTISIYAPGAPGGNGSGSVDAGGGGGGGGGGGAFLITQDDSAATLDLQAPGGAAGNPYNGAAVGVAGTAGQTARFYD